MNLKKNLARAMTAVMVLGTVASFSAATFAADVTNASDTLTREHVSSTATHDVVMTLPATVSGTATFDYASFSSFGGFTSGSGCVGTPTNPSGTTISVVLTSCSGSITFGFDAINPGSSGSYLVQIAGALSGSYSVPIVNDDQIVVSAAVDPSMTFDVGSDTAACSTSWTSSTHAVSFGHLSASRRIASSDDASSTKHICTVLSTNAAGGAVVTVKNANGSSGLVPASAGSGDAIGSATGAINSTTPNYGLCYGTVSGDNGYVSGTTPSGHAPNATSGSYNEVSCTSSVVSGAENVGALSTAATEVWRVAGATSNAFATLRLKVGISATQPAHNDYGDTLTFVATATF